MSLFPRSQLHHSNVAPLVLSLSVITFLLLFSRSTAACSRRHRLQDAPFADGIKNGDGRLIGEETENMILARNRTHRRDPSYKLKRYKGGWDIENRHYWASVVFSGIYMYAAGAAWFIVFGLALLFTCITHFCCREQLQGHDYSRVFYTLTLIILTLFTLAAIVGCGVLYFAEAKFHGRISRTLDFVVSQADKTAGNLTALASYLESAKSIGMSQFTLPEEIRNTVITSQDEADSTASEVDYHTRLNDKRIKKIINIARGLGAAFTSVMLLLAITGFFVSLLGAKYIIYILAILGWITVTVSLVLAGAFIFLHNLPSLVADTCVAMDEWVRNPANHTKFDDILPCVDNAKAHNILQKSKSINSDVVKMINTAICKVANAQNLQPSDAPFYYNQSGPLLPFLCRPYDPNMTDRTCGPGEVDYAHAAEVWKKYVCEVGSDNATCVTTGRLTPAYYLQASNAENVSYGLYIYTPFLADLVTCTFVRRAFSVVSGTYCPGVSRYLRTINTWLVVVSFSVMVAVICWMLYASKNRPRVTIREMFGRSRQASR